MSKILIVEDDPATAELERAILEVEGLKCLVAGDGAMAMKMIEKEKPLLILLDIMLPGMDGYQLSQLIKHNLKYSDIPIIMISAKVSKEDQKLGFEKGADEYIIKPFEPSCLIGIVRKFLSASA